MKSPIRIAHASDVHLDSDYFGGDDNRESCEAYRTVFSNLLDGIQAQNPDIFLLPGDLFDSNRASDETIRWSMEMLGALPFPVVMIPGNHDCLAENGVFRRYDFGALDNVTFLADPEGETAQLETPLVHLWGKGMIDHTPEFFPLQGLAPAKEGYWNLALGHGIYVGKDGNSYRSSPVSAKEIAESGYDYIALGHHHALLDVSQNNTVAFYSGAPMPISSQDKGTYLLTELTEGENADVTIHTV